MSSVEYFIFLQHWKKGLGKNGVICKSRLIVINAACHTQMFGSKLKGMRDILTREITCIPCPGRLDINLRLSLFSGTREMAQGKKACHSWSKNSIFFAVVWIKWMNIFRPAYFTPRHWREGRGGGGDVAVWAKSRVERKH